MPGARTGGPLCLLLGLALAQASFAADGVTGSAKDSTSVAPPAAGAPANPTPAPETSPPTSPAAATPTGATPTGAVPAVQVRVTVPDFGDMVIRVDADRVPNAASLFLTLAATNAFDGLAFHRVIPGLLIQTGNPATRDDDPANDGAAAPPWKLPSETTPRKHARGTVSLAWRGTDPNSAGMQWFVTLADVPALDGRATPIGEVTDGMDVADKIAQVATYRDRRPVQFVRIQSTKLEPPGAHPTPAAAAPAATSGSK